MATGDVPYIDKERKVIVKIFTEYNVRKKNPKEIPTLTKTSWVLEVCRRQG